MWADDQRRRCSRSAPGWLAKSWNLRWSCSGLCSRVMADASAHSLRLTSTCLLRVVLWLRLRDLCDLCGENLVDEQRTRSLKYLVEFRSFHAHANATEITQPYSRRCHYVAAADCAVV